MEATILDTAEANTSSVALSVSAPVFLCSAMCAYKHVMGPWGSYLGGAQKVQRAP